VYQSLLSAKSVTISIIISIIIIITIRPHCWFCLCPLFWRVKKFLRKDERGNIFAFLGRRRSQATGGGQEMVGKKSCLLKKLRLY
jgi:hypothetical protein